MKHLRTQAVEHGEADVGAVFGRIVVEPERALAEGHVDDLDDLDLVGHAAGLGVVGDDRGERCASRNPVWQQPAGLASQHLESTIASGKILDKPVI
jgi:hypothetical protein